MSKPTYAEAMLRKYGFSNRQIQFLILAIDKAKIDTDLTADEVLSVIEGFVMDSRNRARIEQAIRDEPHQQLFWPQGGVWFEQR